jgi:hypothetical protein
MARHSLLLADPIDGQVDPPELREDDYVHEVLARPDGTTEADVEQELMLKAAALGIELPPSAGSNLQEQETRGGESADTHSDAQPARLMSAGSDGTADTEEGSPTSDHAIENPARPTDGSSRRRSRSLSFSQYDRYISQVDPALDQSKFLRPNHDNGEWSTGVVVKSNSRRGVRGFTRSIAAKLMRRRPSPNLPM